MAKQNNQIKKIQEKKRYIYLNGDVDEDSSKSFVEGVLTLELDDPSSDILVLVDSYGGYVDSMWSMIDCMNLCRCKIHTLCTGKAMSAGSLVLMNGDQRYCTQNSRIMLHKMSATVYGDFDTLENQMNEYSRMQCQLDKFIADKTEMSEIDVRKKLSKDLYLDAEKAVELGIVDKIISNFSELKLKGW